MCSHLIIIKPSGLIYNSAITNKWFVKFVVVDRLIPTLPGDSSQRLATPVSSGNVKHSNLVSDFWIGVTFSTPFHKITIKGKSILTNLFNSHQIYFLLWWKFERSVRINCLMALKPWAGQGSSYTLSRNTELLQKQHKLQLTFFMY